MNKSTLENVETDDNIIAKDVSNAALIGAATTSAIEPFGGFVGGAIAGAIALAEEINHPEKKPVHPAQEKPKTP